MTKGETENSYLKQAKQPFLRRLPRCVGKGLGAFRNISLMGLYPVNHVPMIGMVSQELFCTKRLKMPILVRRDRALSRFRDTLDVQKMLSALIGRPTFGSVT